MKKVIIAGLIALMATTASAKTVKYTEAECKELLAAMASSAITIIGIPVSISLFVTGLVGCRHHGLKWR